MKNHERVQILDALKLAINNSDDDIFKKAYLVAMQMDVDKSCSNCTHGNYCGNKKTIRCQLVDKYPPNEVQKSGCPKWKSDGIPIPIGE